MTGNSATLSIKPPSPYRVFRHRDFRLMWIGQLVSTAGTALTSLAASILVFRLTGSAASVGLMMMATAAPSLLVGLFAGVIVDRYDRKRIMRIADLARALVFCALPFATQLWELIVASLLLEVFTLLFAPAKEALVPVLVPRDRLTSANSLGVLAAYGTMPLAGVAQALLKAGNDRLAEVEWLEPLGFGRDIGSTQTLAFYFNALTYLIAFVIVRTLIRTDAKPVHAHAGDVEGGEAAHGLRAVLQEVKDGWHLVVVNPVVRAVNVGLAAGLLGGAMLVPLGPTFAKQILGDVNKFPLYITALGCGVAAGVALLTALQQRIPKTRVFCGALFFGGASILFGVFMSTFWLQAIGVFGLGLGAGSVYVLGYTLLQENTEDDMRGRTFNTFLTLVRLAVLGAMVLGPTISSLVDPLMRRWIGERTRFGTPGVRWFGVEYGLPGVRVTLWLAGVMILVAAALASRSLESRSVESRSVESRRTNDERR